MSEIMFFDSNCRVGMSALQPPRSFHSAAVLLEEMKYHGIGSALVYHAVAQESSPSIGNALLSQEIKGHPELVPCWVVMPHQTGEMPRPSELMAQARTSGVRAVRVYPEEHAYGFDARTCGELLAALEAERIPLLLDLQTTRAKGFDWNNLADLCRSHAELPFVLTRMNWLSNRQLYPLLEKTENLYVETSFYQVNLGIEDFCHRFGAERLLFGTRMPVCSPGASIMMITHADISDEEKSLIAGGNLRRLLGMQSVPAVQPADHGERDPILAKARKGIPIDGELIIDAHGHLGPIREYHVPEDTAEGIVRNLDLAGVDRILLSSLVAIQSDYRVGNDMVGEAVRRFPDRIVGYAVANPHFKDDIEAELNRCFDELRLSAIKIHPAWHQYPVDGPNYQPVWDFATEHRSIVLSHTMGARDEMAKFDALSEKYPQITFILAHAGGSFQNAENYIELGRKRSNVYLEITLSSIPFGMIEHLVEGAGAEKVLYGSDMTYRDHRPQLGWVVYSKISLEDKRKVLGLNIARLLEK